MDNAADNIVAMRELARLLKERDIPFNAINHHIPCFPHMINICVTHMIKAYPTADFTAVAATWVGALDNVMDKAEYLEALAIGPPWYCSHHLSIWPGYTGNTTQVPLVELLHDVKSRWDSTYFMINWLHTIHLICYHYPLTHHTPLTFFRPLTASYPYLMGWMMNLLNTSRYWWNGKYCKTWKSS